MGKVESEREGGSDLREWWRWVRKEGIRGAEISKGRGVMLGTSAQSNLAHYSAHYS